MFVVLPPILDIDIEDMDEELEIGQAQLIRQLGLGLSFIAMAGILLAIGIADVRRIKALGPGGVPFDLRGWLFITLRMRPFSLRQRQTTSVDDYPETGASPDILSLPTRKGPRPVVGCIVPQRQLSDKSSAGRKKVSKQDTRTANTFSLTLCQELQGISNDLVALDPTMLEVKLSHLEKSNPAVNVHRSLLDDSAQRLPEAALVSWGQIGHIHTNSSFHLHFKPVDARIVLERGWGERHRLART